ncbi:MAG: response regulator [Achromobacter sp.]|uniref:response regulator n=1 Tax=Achromobacter sp. TaxID=134375 RepID=UPI0012CD8E1B|nr:response regulator [Achromobacter sp.]MPS81336.1 response regulator [Achromobacter sp.]
MADATPLAACRLLVVEDEYVIAETLAEALREDGATIVGMIGWLDEAMRFASANAGQFNCAVVDINLHGTLSYPLIDALVAQGVHVVLLTGFGVEALDPAYRGFPRCEKPFNQARLNAMLLSGFSR